MNPPRIDVVTADEAARANPRLAASTLPVVHGYFWASIAGMPDDVVTATSSW